MRIALLMVLFTLACVPRWTTGGEFGKDVDDPSKIEICVVNHSINPYRIYIYGRGMGSVYPGEIRKITVSAQSRNEPIIAREIGGWDLYSYPVSLSDHQEWEWELDNTQVTGVVSLHPGSESCDK